MRKFIFFFSFFLILGFLFLIPSFSFSQTFQNTYNFVAYSSTNKQDVLIPTGRTGNITFQDYLIGEIPYNLNPSIFPNTYCSISMGNSSFTEEKCIEMLDLTDSYELELSPLLYSYKSTSGTVETVIQVFNATNLDGGIAQCYIDLGNLSMIILRLAITYDYLDSYMNFQNVIGSYAYPLGLLYHTNMTNIILDYNVYTRNYTITVTDSYNLSNSFSVISTLRYPSFQFLNKLYITYSGYLAATYKSRMFIYGIDSSFSNNYISGQVFKNELVVKNGYFAFKSIQIPISLLLYDEILNLDSYCIYDNVISILNLGQYDYSWYYVYSNYTQLLKIDRNYTLTQYDKLQSYLIIDLYSFNYLQRVNILFQISVYLNVTYFTVLLPPSFFDLSLTFIISFSLLIFISYFAFWLSKKRKFIFWISLFITNICIIIYYNLISNFGAILAIASFFILFFMKFKDEN